MTSAGGDGQVETAVLPVLLKLVHEGEAVHVSSHLYISQRHVVTFEISSPRVNNKDHSFT